MLSVTLFGPGQAHYSQRSLTGFPSQQPTLVLCYLLLNRNHQYGREALAALFWPDGTREASLKALRYTLWRLRQKFTRSVCLKSGISWPTRIGSRLTQQVHTGSISRRSSRAFSKPRNSLTQHSALSKLTSSKKPFRYIRVICLRVFIRIGVSLSVSACGRCT